MLKKKRKQKGQRHIYAHRHIKKRNRRKITCNKRNEQLEKKVASQNKKLYLNGFLYLVVLLDFFDVAFCLCSGSVFACARNFGKIVCNGETLISFLFSPCLLFSNVTFLLTHCGNQKSKKKRIPFFLETKFCSQHYFVWLFDFVQNSQ